MLVVPAGYPRFVRVGCCRVTLFINWLIVPEIKENTLFKKYNTSGMFYAHASVGTLHVRPVLNMKSDQDIKNMK